MNCLAVEYQEPGSKVYRICNDPSDDGAFCNRHRGRIMVKCSAYLKNPHG